MVRLLTHHVITLQDIFGRCSAAARNSAWTVPRGLAPQYRRHSPDDTVMTSKTEAKWNKEYGKKEPWCSAAAAANVATNAAAGAPSTAVY